MENLITVIGRGHSGTRAISHTLYASGVFMGSQLNPSGDKIPPQDMYAACRVLAQYVKWDGGLSWDFRHLFTMPIDPEFEWLINAYLADVFRDTSPHKGWKIPETTLVYPWIARMFPDIKYIHWIRDPRDCIRSSHKTDDLRDFGIDYPATDDIYKKRAISWIYQYQLMKATPMPKNVIQVRFEDFVLDQERTLKALENFLGIPLGRIIVREDAVARWQRDIAALEPGASLPQYEFEFLKEAIVENGYPLTAT